MGNRLTVYLDEEDVHAVRYLALIRRQSVSKMVGGYIKTLLDPIRAAIPTTVEPGLYDRVIAGQIAGQLEAFTRGAPLPIDEDMRILAAYQDNPLPDRADEE